MAFEVKVLADSLNAATGDRLTTYELTYPRCIHAEFMTHRMFSRNAASSRAIPVEKLIQRVVDDPFIPIHWGLNQKGMQADEVMPEGDQDYCRMKWVEARDNAVESVRKLLNINLHKQIANRLLEPWMFITVIASATSFEHFRKLRVHPAAEPHFQKLAGMMVDARDQSTPQKLNPGEWHLPLTGFDGDEELSQSDLVKVSVARCARVSYLTHDGKRDVQADLDLYDRLLSNKHWSPFEHAAYATSDSTWHGNFRGWIQDRKTHEAEFVDDRICQNPHSIKTLILGCHGAGKDEVAEGLDTLPEFNYIGPTSKPLLRHLIKDIGWITEDETHPLCFECRQWVDTFRAESFKLHTLYERRHEFSMLLYSYGKWLRKSKGNLVLVNELQRDGANVIVGLREADECRELIERDKPHVVWVSRPGYEEDPTLEFRQQDVEDWCDQSGAEFTLIQNNGSLEDLAVSVKARLT